MKKKYIIILIVIITIIVAFPFLRNVILIIQKFNSFGNIEQNEVPYNLPEKYLTAQNVRTGGSDTLRFKNVTLINFWASWCIPCLREQPSLEKLKSDRPSLEIIQLSFDSLHSQIDIINKYKWSIPAYYLSDTNFFKTPHVLPTSLVVKNSTVLMEVIGIKNWQDEGFLKFIDSLLVK